ncbi:MAG: HAD-IG family 5'-nucleotidase [bacterium]|nr:HAD-IG family 5'-nucleotidase [bacterium]
MSRDDAGTLRPHPGLRVHTNRNLRLSSIRAMGFDMDHTLAVYNTENFNRLCFELAAERLVIERGYPPEVRSVPWDPDAAIRGLVVDKKLGTILKIDAHGHLTRVRHGDRFLDKDERRRGYPRGRIRIGNARYRVFDTLFDLPEGCLYSGIVALAEKGLDLGVSWRTLYDDIRGTVDTLHADGTLKTRIIADLGRYFLKDPDLVATLERLRSGGRRLFLLTNSEADYTAAVMNHLVGGAPGSWEDLFDLVVCFARKPGFFVARGKGEPIPAGEYDLMPNRSGHCFNGGDAFFLEKAIGHSGDEILYFGDHTFGDILRSKKSVGWRTAMIVPEVAEEADALWPLRREQRELLAVEEHLEDLVLERDRLAELDQDNGDRGADLDRRMGEALGRRARLQRKVRGALNPHWESVFREGRAASRFGRQIMEFSCIYTARVSNLLRYPADKFFSRPLEVLPHDRWILSDR